MNRDVPTSNSDPGATPQWTTEELREHTVLKAQLFIQNNLDADLSLPAVARHVGSSQFHFHRVFKQHLGETLRQYVERLRLEASMHDLCLSELSVLQVALRYGFKSPDTYARAFQRRFGRVPSSIGRPLRSKAADKAEEGAALSFELGLRCSRSSNFSVTRLSELPLMFVRHLGPYQTVPTIGAQGDTLWRQLEEAALEKQLARQPFVYIGIAQDNPETTEPEKLRYDACLLVDRPFEGRGRFGYQKIPSGYYGVLRHAGPYKTLGAAYAELVERASAIDGFRIDPSCMFELLMDVDVKTNEETTWTELYLRLKRREVRRREG